MRYHLLILLALLGIGGALHAEEKVDYLAQAALMIGEGDYERAGEALENVDLKARGLDLKRFYTLRGLIRLRQQAYAGARDDFESVIEQGEVEPQIYVYLAQAHYGLKAYEATLGAIEKAGEKGAEKPGVWQLKALALWESGRRKQAWDTLLMGEARFPEEKGFMRRRVFLLVELGLYQSAATLGQDYLGRYEADVTDYLAIGDALRRGGQLDKALPFLEQARLRFRDSAEPSKVLAHAYLGRQQSFTAAELIAAAAARGEAPLTDAAELYRRAGKPVRALFLNAREPDQKKKFKQRLALLIEMEAFEQATRMEDDLVRSGLLEDENIRYALAYAYFRIGEFDDAERHLESISRSDLFRKATDLRQAMSSCSDERWKCM